MKETIPEPCFGKTLQEQLRGNPEAISLDRVFPISGRQWQKVLAIMSEAADEIDALQSTLTATRGGLDAAVERMQFFEQKLNRAIEIGGILQRNYMGTAAKYGKELRGLK